MNPDMCKCIKELRLKAKNREFNCCKECLRSSAEKYPIFAVGCEKHQTDKFPVILFVLRDPSSPQKEGITGCKQDGNVCYWCHDDPSAKNMGEIIEKIPGLKKDKGQRYPAYFINAVLHGAEKNQKPNSKTIKACSQILKTFIKLLKPKIVVALGLDARNAISYAYKKEMPNFKKKITKPYIFDGMGFWWTYHTSPQSFNNKETEIRKAFDKIANFLNSTIS